MSIKYISLFGFGWNCCMFSSPAKKIISNCNSDIFVTSHGNDVISHSTQEEPPTIENDGGDYVFVNCHTLTKGQIFVSSKYLHE